MKSETQTLTEEMEKLLNRIADDVTSTLVNLSGSLKDIACGTHIKIPTDAGYVNYYKQSEQSETLSLWLKQEIMQNETEIDLIDKYD